MQSYHYRQNTILMWWPEPAVLLAAMLHALFL